MPNQVGRDGKLWMLEIMVQEKNRLRLGSIVAVKWKLLIITTLYNIVYVILHRRFLVKC